MAGEFFGGLLNGFSSMGGMPKLERTIKRALGVYNPYEDELFLKDLQTAGSLGPAAKASFLNQYQPYITYQQPTQGPIRMTPQQQWEQISNTPYDPKINVGQLLSSYDPSGNYAPFNNVNFSVTKADDIAMLGKLSQELAAKIKEGNKFDAEAGYWNQNARLRGNEADYKGAELNYFNKNRVDFGKVASTYGLPNADLYNGLRLSPVETDNMLKALGLLKQDQDLKAAEIKTEGANYDHITAQTGLVNAQTGLINEQTVTEIAERDPKVKLLLSQAEEAKKRGDLVTAQILTENATRQAIVDELKSQIYSNTQQGNQYAANANYINTQNQWYGPKAQASINADIALTNDRNATTNKTLALIPYQQGVYQSQMNQNNAQATYYNKKDPNAVSGSTGAVSSEKFDQMVLNKIYKGKSTDPNFKNFVMPVRPDGLVVDTTRGGVPWKHPLTGRYFNANQNKWVDPSSESTVSKPSAGSQPATSAKNAGKAGATPKYPVAQIFSTLKAQAGVKSDQELAHYLVSLDTNKKKAVYDAYGVTADWLAQQLQIIYRPMM